MTAPLASMRAAHTVKDMDEPRPATIHSLTRRRAQAFAGAGRPVKARPAHVHRKMDPDAAFRATLSDCLAQMTANAGVVRAGRSVEGLHQLRVAMRRLDVALKGFGEEFGQPWLAELRSRAKVLASRLAPARDLDVFTGELLTAPAKAFGAETFAGLRAAAEALRTAHWEQAHATVAGADFALFLDDLAALAHSRLPLGRHGKLAATAARLLARQHARAKKRAVAARSQEERDLHRLRIALKGLRYTAEFFAPLYDRGQVRRYLKEVKTLQDSLGRLNDIAHAQAMVGTLAPAGAAAELRHAAGAVEGWYRASRPRLVSQALKRWDKFKALPRFWE